MCCRKKKGKASGRVMVGDFLFDKLSGSNWLITVKGRLVADWWRIRVIG
jgi:hypothetical protein